MHTYELRGRIKTRIDDVRYSAIEALSHPAARNAVDFTIFASGVASAIGSNILDPGLWQKLLGLYAEGSLITFGVSSWDRFRRLSEDRIDQIAHGVRPMRRHGEVLPVFGGLGGHTFNTIAQRGVSVLPIVDDEEGIRGFRTWLRTYKPEGFRVGKKTEIIQEPFFLNLQIGSDPAARQETMMDSSNFDLVHWQPDNMLLRNGKRMFVSVGIGANPEEALLGTHPHHGLPPSLYAIAHDTMHHNAIWQNAVKSLDDHVKIDVDDEIRFESGLAPRNISDARSTLWLDPIKIMFQDLRKKFPDTKRIPLLVTAADMNRFRRIPLDTLGWDWINDPLKSDNMKMLNTTSKSSPNLVEVVFETDDSRTLRTFLFNPRRSIANPERRIPIFRSVKGMSESRVRRVKGLCIPVMLSTHITSVQKKLRLGIPIGTIQESIDMGNNATTNESQIDIEAGNWTGYQSQAMQRAGLINS